MASDLVRLFGRLPLPTPRWFAATVAAAALFLWSDAAALAALAGLLALLFHDGRPSRTAATVAVDIALPSLASLGQDVKATLRIERLTAGFARGTAALELDGALAGDDAVAIQPFRAANGAPAELDFTLPTRRRGVQRVHAVHLGVVGPLGLAMARERRPLPAEVRVVPGLAAAQRLELMHRSGLRPDLGRHRTRARDDAGAFDSLREYHRGDDPRRIDWKASARRGTTVVRQMTAERRQDIVIAVDVGRTLREPHEGLERLDHALAAASSLAAAADAFGDRVGLLAFAGRVERLLPPERRPMGRLARELSDLEARAEEPDYRGALLELANRLPRRALVVLLSDAVDGEVSEPLIAGLGLLRTRHVPLFVALRSPALAAARGAPLANHEAVLQRAALLELERARRAALDGLRRRGVDVIDTPASEAATAAVAGYLEIKRRGAL